MTDASDLPAAPRMTRGLTILFAIAAGAAVGNLYYAQPLLDLIGREFHESETAAGGLITATQIGYAVGIFLILPLGDIVNRKRLIPFMMLLSAIALALASLTPTILLLGIALGAVGLTTLAGQMLAPLAADLADDASRGRTVGIVVSGIITGILVSRTLSGFVAGLFGWRAIYVLAAAATALLAVLLYRAIPRLTPNEQLPYPRLLASVLRLVARERLVRLTLVFGSAGFGVFTLFWTALTFLLSGPPYNYPAALIGLFGLAGLAGSFGAQGAGRLHDRGWSVPVFGAAWALTLIAWVAAGLGQNVVGIVIAAVVVLDLGIQSAHILNQSRLFHRFGAVRSRVNTAYVTSNFIGGGIGSLLASLLWPVGGWTAIAIVGSAISALALLLWVFTRRQLREA